MSDEKIGISAHPLYWPDGWTRTKPGWRTRSKFKSTFAVARDELITEIGRLRGRYYSGRDEPILSTNVALRNDGLPYANQREPDDGGVAVYFKYKDKQMCFACDKYTKVWENMVAIRKTIEAIRGIERWGASDMMERAFQGFVALPSNDWRGVLGLGANATLSEARDAYRRRAATTHPDRPGGSNEHFQKVQAAWMQAQAELT